MEYNVTGKISDQEFLSINQQCSDEIAAANAQIEELERQQLSVGEFSALMDNIRKTLHMAKPVSYTHLDVYKRQPYTNIRFDPNTKQPQTTLENMTLTAI